MMAKLSDLRIMELYGDALQDQRTGLLLPQSSLPAAKSVIKAALIAEGLKASREGRSDDLNTIRTSYCLLYRFVPDDVAERSQRQHEFNSRTSHFESLEDSVEFVRASVESVRANVEHQKVHLEDVKKANNKIKFLKHEFDARLAKG